MESLGCHSLVTIVTKKYLLSPSSGPNPGLGVDKDNRDACYCLCCPRAPRLLEKLDPSEGMTEAGSRPSSDQPSLERQVCSGPSLSGGI